MSRNLEIKKFILSNYLFTEDLAALGDEDSLMKKGVIDSTGILELVSHIEETYKFKIADEDMTPENLDSVTRIVQFIERKSAA